MVRLVQGQCGLAMELRLVRGSAGRATFCSIGRSRVHFCGMSRPRDFPLMEIRSMSCGRIECTKHILGFLVLTSIVVLMFQSGKVADVSPDSDL